MDSLRCAANSTCRIYCEALRAQGVEVGELGEPGVCGVPDMLSVEGDQVVFDPRSAEEAIKNLDLVNELGGKLCNVLFQESSKDTDGSEFNVLLEAHEQVFASRLELWRAMLDASKDNRQFTDVELDFYQEKLAETEVAARTQAEASSAEAILSAQVAFDHKTLSEYGLMFDEQMISVTNRLIANQMDGKPTLIVGDKGIAKTQAAKFVANLNDTDKEPVIISGHGDMMSNELIGQMEQDKDTRVFAFKEGKLVQAMREGRPVILDEVNIGDQAIVMRLQDILLRRPGDNIVLQENGGNSIEIQPGFVVYATANEASARYQHRNVLDPAFRDRYDIIQLNYPDSEGTSPITEVPSSLLRLALAAGSNEQGELSPHIRASELEELVRLAHVTQHLYSVPARNANLSSLGAQQSTSSFISEEPVMTDCITPRSVADIVARCAPGNKLGMTLGLEIARAIKGLDQAGSKDNQDWAKKAQTLLQTNLRSSQVPDSAGSSPN